MSGILGITDTLKTHREITIFSMKKMKVRRINSDTSSDHLGVVRDVFGFAMGYWIDRYDFQILFVFMFWAFVHRSFDIRYECNHCLHASR